MSSTRIEVGPEHRRAADRRGLRYPSDLTDGEWALVEPAIPPAKRGGRRREVNVREVLNAIFYVLSTGCPLRQAQGEVAGLAERPAAEEHGPLLLHAVGLGRHVGAPPPCALCRGARTRRPGGEPDGCDHRQPKRQGRSKGGSALDPQGFDAGKKVTGRKRHILVDTLGLLLNVTVHSAGIQDRDAARLVLNRRTRRLFPFIERIFADAGYQGMKAATAVAKSGTWRLEIVKRNELHRFVVLPKRWIVERTLAWISHHRRRARLRAIRANRRRLHPPRHDPHHAPTLGQPNSLLMNRNFLDRLSAPSHMEKIGLAARFFLGGLLGPLWNNDLANNTKTMSFGRADSATRSR